MNRIAWLLLNVLPWCFLGFGFIVSAHAEEARPDSDAGRTELILAVSWQPGFCETHSKKAECASQTPDRFDARNFTLHGLWKMKSTYCGIGAEMQAVDKSGAWDKLPEIALTQETRTALQEVMPGVQSGLDRHEWIKHGTCSGLTADVYFKTAMRLLADLNASAVKTLFASRIGDTLSATEIGAAFDTTFGPGSASRVKMRCEKQGARRLIAGMTIGLGGEGATKSLAEGMRRAGSTEFGCPDGEVDAVGQL